MEARIITQPNEVWKKLQLNNGGMFLIAENKEYGVEIFARSTPFIDASIMAVVDDVLDNDEEVFDADDCAKTVQRFYDTYLTPELIEKVAAQDNTVADYDDIEDAYAEAIDQREAELTDAVYELLCVIMDDVDVSTYFDEEEQEKLCDDLKNKVCGYLAGKYYLPVYRPAIITDESGQQRYSDYPYSQLN
jgi:hypothetical protein